MDDISKARRSWEKLLNQQTLRTNLLLASLYLTAYELLKGTVVERIRSFLLPNFIDGANDPIFPGTVSRGEKVR